MTISVTSVTAEKAAEIADQTVVTALLTPAGDLVVETAAGTRLNVGHIAVKDQKFFPSIVTLSAFDFPQEDVLVPDWLEAGGQNTRLAAVITSGFSAGRGIAFSPDGVYAAVTGDLSPYIYIWKKSSGDTWTQLPNPGTLPNSSAGAPAWSPDGLHLVVPHANGANLTIYKRSGDTFTKLSNPSVVPEGRGLGAAFSPSGQYLSVTFDASPWARVWKRSGDTFTAISIGATFPSALTGLPVWSPDGRYLVFTRTSSPYFSIHKRTADTFAQLPDPSVLPTNGTVFNAAWSPDGIFLALACTNSPYILLYHRDGDVFTEIPNAFPGFSGSRNMTGIAWSPDGQYLAASSSSSPYLYVFRQVRWGVFEAAFNPSAGMAWSGGLIAWTPNGHYLGVCTSDTDNSHVLYKSSFGKVQGIAGKVIVAP